MRGSAWRWGGIAAITVGEFGRAGLRGLGARALRTGTVRGHLAHALPTVVERLGPAFVKFAQIASTRHDALPPAVCVALARLHAQVTPPPPGRMLDALHTAYDGRPGAVFARIDDVPLGSGSIACVYRAVLHDGTPVAVKVRRPGIEASVRRDVALIQSLIELVARIPALRAVPLAEMGRAVGAAVVGQLDFAAEAGDLAVLRDSFAGLSAITVPDVVTAASRPDCLVMELLTLRPAELADALPVEQRRRLARETLLAVFDMLFRSGVVHCDLHPGNLVLVAGTGGMVSGGAVSGGSIGIIDAGFVCRIPPQVRRQLALFFLNLGFRNGPRCADAVVGSAAGLGPTADLPGFEESMCRLVDRYGGVTARDFDLIAFSVALFEAQQRHGIYASSEFVFPLLSLLMVEGWVSRLDPDLDFQALARPVVFRVAADLVVPAAASTGAVSR